MAAAYVCQSLECLDILVTIFYKLRPADVASCALTCRLWRKAAADITLWRHFCVQRWPSLSDPAALPCLSRLRSFSSFFSQRATNAPVLPSKDAALFLLHATYTLLLDVALADRSLFSIALPGSALVRDRLRFKLPLPSGQDGVNALQHLHVQLSIVRHTDGLSACLVNGFPTSKSREVATSTAGVKGLKCVLMLIDNHAFLNFYW
eukprot:c7119_g1_i1 orf=213-830(+)